MVVNHALAFLPGFDEDHFGPSHGKHMRGIPFTSHAGNLWKVLKGKVKRMWNYEDLEKGNIFGLADWELYVFNGFVHLASYHFGISWYNSRIRVKQNCQESFHFRFWYVHVTYLSCYIIVIFWKKIGLACFGTCCSGCYSLFYWSI